MKIRIEIVGTQPLLMHNPRLVDSQDPIVQQIKALTSKKKKTESDVHQIEKLEWYGGIYADEAGVYMPTSSVRKSLINTARMSKLGKAVERTILLEGTSVALTYDGPEDIDELYADKTYHSRLAVGVGQKRVMRVRPKFPRWALSVDGVFIDDAGLTFSELERIVELAGQAEGIGDGRAIGYGRFAGKVRAL